MSRRQRQRREAMEAKLLALCPTDETDDMDREDADFDSLAVYREAERPDQPIDATATHQSALQP